MPRSVRLLSAVLLLAGAASADKHVLIGTWELALDRPGMQPRQCAAELTLRRHGGKWSGTIRFRTILYAKPHELDILSVKGKRITFRVAGPKYSLQFAGERKGRGLRGTCAWRGLGDYAWTAVRAGTPPRLLDPGLSFGRDLPQGPAEGLDEKALGRLLRSAAGNGSSAVCVVHDGRVVAERHFGGKPRPIHVMSVTKFLTAMAVAYLVEEKKIASLDAPLSTWFPEWKDGRRAQVTLRHVLAHTSGIRHAKSASELNRQPDKVAWVRKHPVETAPGEKFSYHTGYLGQWLVICPERKLVGVRLRQWDSAQDPAREFGGFLRDLLAVVK